MVKIKLPHVRFFADHYIQQHGSNFTEWRERVNAVLFKELELLLLPRRSQALQFKPLQALDIATSVVWFRAKMQTVVSHLLYKMERGLTKLRGKHAARRPHNMFVFVEQMNSELVPDVSTRSAVWRTQQGTSNYGEATVRPYLRLHSILQLQGELRFFVLY